MRLMLINDKILPGGGSEHSVRVQLSGMIEMGHSVLVATTRDQVDAGLKDPELKGVEWFPFQEGAGFHSALTRACVLDAAARNFRADLLELGNMYGLLGPTGALRLERRWKVVHACRDARSNCARLDRVLPSDELCQDNPGLVCLSRNCTGHGFRPRALRALLEGSLRFRALRRAKAVVVESTAFRDLLRCMGIPEEKIHVLPMAVRTPSNEIGPPSEAPPHILGVGLLEHPVKGLEHLVRVFAEIQNPEARLRLTGAKGEAWNQVVPLIKELELSGRIDPLGWLEEEELSAERENCRVAAFPSRFYESFGLAGAEVAAAGRPVVAVDCGGSRDWIRDNETGALVDREDVSAMAVALDRYLNDPELSNRHGAAGHAYICDRFTREANLQAISEVYEGVLAQ